MDDYSSIMVKALADRLAEVSIMKGTQVLPLELLLKPLALKCISGMCPVSKSKNISCF